MDKLLLDKLLKLAVVNIYYVALLSIRQKKEIPSKLLNKTQI